MKPVCLVIGAGAGIGGNAGKRFAALLNQQSCAKNPSEPMTEDGTLPPDSPGKML